jgi:MacB-like periplasmic core domain
MTARGELIFRQLDVCLLWSASLLVPGRLRGEWLMEWQSELWHVRQACSIDSAVSWGAELEVGRFCLGAFQDAFWLMREYAPARVPLATTKGSALQCLQFLVVVIAVSYGIALLLPGVRSQIEPVRSRIAPNLVLIRNARYSDDSVPTISAEQFETWKGRSQQLFEGFAFYTVGHEAVSGVSNGSNTVGVAHASANLFEMLRMSLRSPLADGLAPDSAPRAILSEAMWRARFGGRSDIAGQMVRIGSRDAVVAGVVNAASSKLPGKVDVWLLEPDEAMAPDSIGFVVAQLTVSGARDLWSEHGHMSARTPDGSMDDFLCTSLAQRTPGPRDLFLFAVLLACLALPATTSLPLGEYRLSSRRLSWPMRIRRWTFLCSKLTLLMVIVYFVSLDLAYLRTTMDPSTSEFIQLVASFSICLFGLRWTLRDQRQRCPVCLGKLSHPARVGQPSRTFLAWNGTELICVGGHGLLHVPEMPTSWFSTQRWLYLDPSWEVLFPEAGLVTSGYF